MSNINNISSNFHSNKTSLKCRHHYHGTFIKGCCVKDSKTTTMHIHLCSCNLCYLQPKTNLTNMNRCVSINSPFLRPSLLIKINNNDECQKDTNTQMANAHLIGDTTQPSYVVDYSRPKLLISDHMRQYIRCKKNITSQHEISTRNFLIFTLVIVLALEFASYFSVFLKNNNPSTHHYSDHNFNYKLNLPTCIMAEAVKLTGGSLGHSRVYYHIPHHHPHHQQWQKSQYNVGEDIEKSSNNDDQESYHHQAPLDDVDHENLFGLSHENDLVSDINNINSNNILDKIDDTSPVVVNSGSNSYVSANPISIESTHNNHHEHQFAHQPHMRQPRNHVRSSLSSTESFIINNNNSSILEDTNNTLNIPEILDLENSHVNDDGVDDGDDDDDDDDDNDNNNNNNDDGSSSLLHHSFQQNKRSNVHNGADLTEKSMRISQNGDTIKHVDLPAEMFIVSPFGSNSNSLRAKFSMNPATIIRTRESLALGAVFLNHSYVEDFNSCLNDCWRSQFCDTAIYQETPAPSSNLNKLADGFSKNDYVCYQFSCFKEEKLICKFTSHNFYVSSFLKNPRSKEPKMNSFNSHNKETFDGQKGNSSGRSSAGLSAQEIELHQLRVHSLNSQKENQLKLNHFFDSSDDLSRKIDQIEKPRLITSHKLEGMPINFEDSSRDRDNSSSSRCHKYQFKCHSDGECIAIYNVCDGINQCSDGSDEKYCLASTTTQPTVTNTIHDVDLDHRKSRLDKFWTIDKDSNYPELGATVHPMRDTKEQGYDDLFKQSKLDFLTDILNVPKSSRKLTDDFAFDGQLYPSIESNLGVEGFFDKDGRFITYNDAENSIYSMDNTGLLFSGREPLKQNGLKEDLSVMADKPIGKSGSILSTYEYKPSSSLETLREPHKTFLVPNSFNQVEQSDKLIDIQNWRHLKKGNDRVHESNQAQKHELRQLDKTPINDVSEKSKEISAEGSTLKSDSLSMDEHKKLKNLEMKSLEVNNNLVNQDSSITEKILSHPSGQSRILYDKLRDGRFHSTNQDYWRDTHIASITIGQEEFRDFSARGTHSALIAFMFGVAITGMLLVIVGLKMKSIRKKIVRRGRRRSLVHEANDFLINGMHL